MAFDFNMTRLLLNEWRSSGEDFKKTVVLGRQGLHVSPDRLQRNLNDFGLSGVDSVSLLSEKNGYYEPFLRILGADSCLSIDVSSYEGASLILDMNVPISDSLHASFDTVIDSGSLEHIFNFPMAIKNCLSMAKENGRVILITPTNNFSGHGFYQFSPELFFGIFSEENGYAIEKMIFYEDRYHAKWYSVTDPKLVKQRVEFVNSMPSYLFIVARRKVVKGIFSQYPNQSDYSNIAWNTKSQGPYEIMTSMKQKLQFQKQIPYLVRRLLSHLIEKWRELRIFLFGKISKLGFFKRI